MVPGWEHNGRGTSSELETWKRTLEGPGGERERGLRSGGPSAGPGEHFRASGGGRAIPAGGKRLTLECLVHGHDGVLEPQAQRAQRNNNWRSGHASGHAARDTPRAYMGHASGIYTLEDATHSSQETPPKRTSPARSGPSSDGSTTFSPGHRRRPTSTRFASCTVGPKMLRRAIKADGLDTCWPPFGLRRTRHVVRLRGVQVPPVHL